MNKSRYKNRLQAGFTYFELIIAIFIVGILAVIAMVEYNHYVNKTRMVESVLMIGAIRKEIETDYSYSNRLPDSVSGAASSIAAYDSNIHDSDIKVVDDSDLIDSYWYYKNDEGGYGWLALQINSDTIFPCDENCQVHLGFMEVNDDVRFWCGVWNVENQYTSYPYSILPTGCRETCVSCQLGVSADEEG